MTIKHNPHVALIHRSPSAAALPVVWRWPRLGGEGTDAGSTIELSLDGSSRSDGSPRARKVSAIEKLTLKLSLPSHTMALLGTLGDSITAGERARVTRMSVRGRKQLGVAKGCSCLRSLRMAGVGYAQ